MQGYTTTERMNDYVGVGIYADVTWERECPKRDNGRHNLGLLNQACVACGDKPTITYTDRLSASWSDASAATREPRKALTERCAQWVRGRQCDNYVSDGRRYCAVHDRSAATREP
jgi:hypothetical protein